MYVIGVAGQLQMGKDSVANRLADKLNERGKFLKPWGRSSFAYNVKKVYCDTFCKDMDFVEKWKVIEDPPPNFSMSVRKSLQFIGDGFRKIQPTIWLDLVFRNSDPKIISDVRYLNEVVRVKEEGGLNILVVRRDRLNDDPNGSESQIRPYVQFFVNLWNRDTGQLPIRSDEYLRVGDVPYFAGQYPDYMSFFDLVVFNNSTLDDLYQTVDEEVVPFVENFVFHGNSEE